MDDFGLTSKQMDEAFERAEAHTAAILAADKSDPDYVVRRFREKFGTHQSFLIPSADGQDKLWLTPKGPLRIEQDPEGARVHMDCIDEVGCTEVDVTLTVDARNSLRGFLRPIK